MREEIPQDIRSDPEKYEQFVRARFADALTSQPDSELSRRAQSLIDRCALTIQLTAARRRFRSYLGAPLLSHITQLLCDLCTCCSNVSNNSALQARGGKAGFLARFRRKAEPIRATSTRVKVLAIGGSGSNDDKRTSLLSDDDRSDAI